MVPPFASLLILLAMPLALWQWFEMPRPRGRHFKLLGVLIVLALLLEIGGGISNAQGLNNSIAYNLFNLIEAFLFLLIVWSIRPKWNLLLAVLAALIASAFALNLLLNEDRLVLLNDAIIFAAIIHSALCMAVLWHLAQTSPTALVRVPEFWLFLGFLVYFAGIVPVIGLQRFIYLKDWPTASGLYKIVPGLCVIRYLLAAYSCRLVAKAARDKVEWRSASAP